MKHYKDESNNIYAYESDGSQDDYIKPGLVPISDEDLILLRAPTLPDAVVAKIAQLTQAYQDAIQQPVAYMDTMFQADNDSQDVISKTLSPGVIPLDMSWLDIDNIPILMTFEQLQGLSGVILAQGWAAFQNLQRCKTDVRAATTVEDVDAVI